MTVQFRNVDVDPRSDPNLWPFEAVLAAIDRGSITDWRRLAAAIRGWPWGPCAQAVATIVEWDEHYGVDRILRDVLDLARDQADRSAAAAFGARCRALRASLGMSLRDFAPYLGTSPSRLSTYENGTVAPSVAIATRLEEAERHLGR